jgi:hypothetical protein
VVDRRKASLIKLAPDGRRLAELGGPGSAEGQFDEPAGVDPTNGLVLVVADAGNGRIQRFSREFLFLEMLPVGSVDAMQQAAFARRPHYRQREQDLVGFGSGRPIAVATSADNDMFVLEESERVVIKWDADRKLERVIGSYDQGAGALVQPVDLALESGGTLYVADRGLESVQVYDAFGSYERSIGQGLCGDARAVALAGDALLVALPDAILWFQRRGLFEEKWALELEDPVVDLALRKAGGLTTLYVLTRKTLLRLELQGE